MTAPFEPTWRERLLRAIDIGMMVVALVAFASLVLEYGIYLNPHHTAALQTLDVVVIVLFVLDMALKLAIVPRRLAYLREHAVQYVLLAVLLVGLSLAHRLPSHPGVEKLLQRFNITSLTKLYLVIIQIAIAVRLMIEAASLQRQLGTRRFRPVHILVGGFAAVILVGTLLLYSPRATPGEGRASFVDALFTATSATCVTGLTVQDTGTYFTPFGQGVILLLIQIGGLGLMTFTAFFAIVLGVGMNAKDRMVMQDVLNERTMGSVGRMVMVVLLLTFAIEAIGAALLYSLWNGPMTTSGRLYTSVFHSVSAFCNAGFSLFPRNLETFRNHVGLNAVIGALIVLGGLGFVVHRNLIERLRGKWRAVRMPFSLRGLVEPPPRVRLSLHTRIVLITTAALIAGGALVFWLIERDGSLAHMPPGEQALAATFQSVTARTAGFNTVDIGKLSGASQLLLIALMFIGASPGSTGGSIKTVAFALLLLAVITALRRRERFELFRRGVPRSALHNALVVLVVALTVVVVATVLLCFFERSNGITLGGALFEVVSAFATVGLSTGITATLTTGGKIVIILTMLVGRIGPLTLVLAMGQRAARADYEYPEEDVMIG